MGLFELGAIAVDGIKVKANASRHKAMSYGQVLKAEAKLKAQIDARPSARLVQAQYKRRNQALFSERAKYTTPCKAGT